MLYTVFLLLAYLTFAVAIFFTVRASRRYKTTQIITPSRIMTVGVFLSSVFLYVPYYWAEMFANDFWLLRALKTVALSLHNTIRMFVVDTDLSDLLAVAANSGTWLYTLLGSLLFVAAPVLTVTVVLSFFKNFSAYRRYFLHPRTATFVFSELNERALMLAKQIVEANPKVILVFADVFKDEDEEETFEMVERAKELGAICFKKDMLSLNLRWTRRNSPLCFFAIAQDHPTQKHSGERELWRHRPSNSTAAEENVKQAYQIATDEYYSKRKKTSVYVFSEGTHGEILLDSLPSTGVHVRLFEEARPAVLEALRKYGLADIFRRAVENESGIKEIRAVIVGAGSYGTEFLKALVWYTQVPGYRLYLDVFDADPTAEERFAFSCPGLMDPKNNGRFIDGMPQYFIRFHSGVPVNTRAFAEQVAAISCPTFAFVALGVDVQTVECAVALRRLFRQMHCPFDPPIHAVVYDEMKKCVYEHARHWDGGEKYGINYFGDLEETCGRILADPEIERKALEVHEEHEGKKATFYKSMYNRRSSEAFAVHRELCVALGLVPATPEDGWPQEVLERAQRIEHCRWVAFMLTEGYVYSGSVDSTSDDRFGRLHHNILPYDMLSEEAKRDTLAWRMKEKTKESAE